MSLQISMVLFDETPVFSMEALAAAFTSNWPDLPPVTDMAEQDNILSFRLGEADIAILTAPVPVPWSDLEGPCATSILWPDATASVGAHKSHAIVTVRGELDPIAIATLLTQVSAALMAATPSALGVFWTNATLVVPKNLFIDFAVDVLPLGPPLAIWVDYRVGPTDNEGVSRGFTTGLAELGLMELEAQAAPESPSELRKRFEGISGYLLEHGLVIQDGDTLGESATEKIRVLFSPSSFGNKDQVMQLVYEPVAEKKSWWKPW